MRDLLHRKSYSSSGTLLSSLPTRSVVLVELGSFRDSYVLRTHTGTQCFTRGARGAQRVGDDCLPYGEGSGRYDRRTSPDPSRHLFTGDPCHVPPEGPLVTLVPKFRPPTRELLPVRSVMVLFPNLHLKSLTGDPLSPPVRQDFSTSRLRDEGKGASDPRKEGSG